VGDTFSTNVHGVPELADQLDQLGEDMHAAAEQEFGRTADRLADIVAGRVPVVSGAMAASVEGVERAAGAAVTMGDGLEYVGWVEFGGSRGRAYYPEGRYMMPTVDEHQADIEEAAHRAAESAIERM